MKKRWPLALSIGILAIGGAILIYITSLTNTIDQSAGPTLSFDLPTLAVEAEPDSGAATPAALDNAPEAHPTVAALDAEPSAGVQPLCGGPERMLLLAIGTDVRKDTYERGRADAIRIARVDFVRPSVEILSIPRDVWVAIPRLEHRGITEGRINSTYNWGNLYLSQGEGPVLLAQTLFVNFGLPIDHYVAINRVVFEQAIDAIGGIDVTLPEWDSGLKAGTYHWDGETVVGYISRRWPDSDLGRIDRQTLVLLGIREALIKPKAYAALPSLLTLFMDDVLTDMASDDVLPLFCLAKEVDRKSIAFYDLPSNMWNFWTTDTGAQVIKPRTEALRGFFQQFMNGELYGVEE